MEYRRLGRAGVKVSAIGYGNWLTHGGGIEPEQGRACLRRAIELGVNFIDTADIYRKGAAETFLGEEMQGMRRQDFVLATKCFWPMSENINDRGLSRKHIWESAENSLERLQTDYIDLYQCHRFDPEVEIEEIVRAMDDLIRHGLILYWGVSEWPALEIKNACAVARQMNACPPVSNQPEYSLAARRVETNGVQSACVQDGLGMVVWSPLKQGVLTGKYSGGAIPKDSRAGLESMNKFIQDALQGPRGRVMLDRTDKMCGLARELGISPAQLALSWVLQREGVSSAIVGASRPGQLDDNVGAVGRVLDSSTMETLDGLFPAGEFA